MESIVRIDAEMKDVQRSNDEIFDLKLLVQNSLPSWVSVLDGIIANQDSEIELLTLKKERIEIRQKSMITLFLLVTASVIAFVAFNASNSQESNHPHIQRLSERYDGMSVSLQFGLPPANEFDGYSK